MLVLSIALLAAACGADGDTEETPEPEGASDEASETPDEDGESEGEEATAGDAEQGGSLTVALGATPSRGLDPANIGNFTPSSEGNFLPAIYGMLAYLDAETGQVETQLAESLEPNDDGSVWTLTLHPGITFSDGTPFDAEAVAYNYERHQDEEVASQLAGIVSGLEFEVVDELELEISLPVPNLHFDKTMAVNLPYIGSPTALEDDPEAFARAPVGAGPFVLTEYEDDSHLTLVRNEEYFEEGEPYLDELTFRVIPDAQQRIQAVSAGEAHIAVPGSDLSLLDEGVDLGLEVASAELSGGTVLIFNTQRAPFDDVRARRAVATALEADAIVQVADGGSEARGPRSLFAPDSPFYDESRQFPGGDMDAAQDLLDEIAADGEPVSFAVSMPQGGQWRRYGEFIQSQLSELDNITVETNFMENAAMAAAVFGERDYDLAGFISNMPDPEPNLFNLVHSGGRDNHSQFDNAEVDAALERIWSAPDDEARAEIYAEIEQLLIEEVPIWPLKSAVAYSLHSDDVQGITLHSEGAILWDRVSLR